MTRQNAHSMTEPVEEIMDGWDIAKEHCVQDKSYCEYYDDSLLRQRDVMFPKQMDLSLNVLELLYGCHDLPLCLLAVLCQTKNPNSTCSRIGIASSSIYPPGNGPLQRWTLCSPAQVSWLPGSLFTRLPMVTHSGWLSFRARYSCGNSGLAALPLSEESNVQLFTSLERQCPYVRGIAPTLSTRIREGIAHLSEHGTPGLPEMGLLIGAYF